MSKTQKYKGMPKEKEDKGSRNCLGGWEAHEASMEINGDCPWCGSYDTTKWL